MIIAGILIVGFIGAQLIIQQLKIKVITEDYHIMERRCQSLRSYHASEVTMLNAYIAALKEENTALKQKAGGQRIVYQTAGLPDGVLDAVKIAMKASHPDNGGKAAYFIKYNELYKKLSK